MTTSTPQSASEQAEQRTQPDATDGGQPAAGQTAAARRRRIVIIVSGAVLLIAVAIFIWKVFFAAPAVPDSIVALSGRIEGDDSAVAPKTSGKILEITVREGDTVTAGQVIARLDDAQVRAREDQARAALVDAQAKSQVARDQIAVLQDQLLQNQLQTGQSTMDADGRVRQAQADLTAAEADLVQQQGALRLAEFNRDAYARLAMTGAASKQQGLQTEVQADQQAAVVAAAQ